MRRTAYVIPTLVLLSWWRPAAAEPLRDLVLLVRAATTQAAELDEVETELRRAELEARRPDAAYDWNLFGEAQWYHDRSEQVSRFAGDWRDRRTFAFGARRLLPTATFAQVKLQQQRDYTEYPPPEPTPQPSIPGLPALPSFDVSQFQTYNPAYTTRLELLVRQPLWRNWLGRELALTRELAASGTIQPRYQRRLVELGIGAEVEQLYWTGVGLARRVQGVVRLQRLTRRLVELTRHRVGIGRADEVDLANAEAAEVRQEGARLELQIAFEQVAKRLAERTALPLTTVAGLLRAGALDRPVGCPVPSDAETAYAQAVSQRIDLELLHALEEPLRLQLALAAERAKPDLSANLLLATNGLRSFPESSFVDAFDDAKHYTAAIGLQFDWKLDDTTSRIDAEVARARLANLAARRAKVLRELRRDLVLAYHDREAARRRLAQTERQRRALAAKVAAAERKLAQARTDEILIVSYRLDLTAVELDAIGLRQQLRQSEARIRTLMHLSPLHLQGVTSCAE